MSWKTEDLLNKAVVYFQRAFALDRENDPKDYYGIKFDPRDYVDDEYGND
jgi:hypothetical protein